MMRSSQRITRTLHIDSTGIRTSRSIDNGIIQIDRDDEGTIWIGSDAVIGVTGCVAL